MKSIPLEAIRKTPEAGKWIELVKGGGFEWGGEVAKGAGKRFLRLDRVADDRKIRDYYEKAGFYFVGDASSAVWKASLHQEKLD